MATLEQKLEAVLFYRGEAETKQRLAKLLDVSVQEIDDAAHALSSTLAQRGVRLLHVHDELELVTAPETSDLIQAIRKEELVRDLGRAGSETLAVILYRGPVSRAQIDHIRGVNSSFILRNLLIRGLIERTPHPENARAVLYRPTSALLSELGITRLEDLPEYDAVRADVSSFETRTDIEHVAAQEPTPDTAPGPVQH